MNSEAHRQPTQSPQDWSNVSSPPDQEQLSSEFVNGQENKEKSILVSKLK